MMGELIRYRLRNIRIHILSLRDTRSLTHLSSPALAFLPHSCSGHATIPCNCSSNCGKRRISPSKLACLSSNKTQPGSCARASAKFGSAYAPTSVVPVAILTCGPPGILCSGSTCRTTARSTVTGSSRTDPGIWFSTTTTPQSARTSNGRIK